MECVASEQRMAAQEQKLAMARTAMLQHLAFGGSSASAAVALLPLPPAQQQMQLQSIGGGGPSLMPAHMQRQPFGGGGMQSFGSPGGGGGMQPFGSGGGGGGMQPFGSGGGGGGMQPFAGGIRRGNNSGGHMMQRTASDEFRMPQSSPPSRQWHYGYGSREGAGDFSNGSFL